MKFGKVIAAALLAIVGYTLVAVPIYAQTATNTLTVEERARLIAEIQAKIAGIQMQLVPLLAARVGELRAEVALKIGDRMEELRLSLVNLLRIRVIELQAQVETLLRARGLK